jgi:hypothetical protein
MNKNYKITLKSHLVQIWPIFIYLSAALLLPLYFSGKYKAETIETITHFSGLLLAFLIIPMLILHLRYFMLNRESLIEEKSKNIFSLKIQDLELSVKTIDIEKIDIYKSVSAYYKGFRVLPVDNYFYGVIKLKSGQDIIITTLIDPELVWLSHLNVNKINTFRSVFCWC